MPSGSASVNTPGQTCSLNTTLTGMRSAKQQASSQPSHSHSLPIRIQLCSLFAMYSQDLLHHRTAGLNLFDWCSCSMTICVLLTSGHHQKRRTIKPSPSTPKSSSLFSLFLKEGRLSSTRPWHRLSFQSVLINISLPWHSPNIFHSINGRKKKKVIFLANCPLSFYIQVRFCPWWYLLTYSGPN